MRIHKLCISILIATMLSCITIYPATSSVASLSTNIQSKSYTVNTASSSISTKSLNTTTNNTTVTGSLPVVSLSNASLSTTINNNISSDYDNRVANARNANAKKITFSYQVFSSNGLTSILVFSETTNLATLNSVDSYVFDGTKLYTTNDILGTNGTAIVSTRINQDIRKTPSSYTVESVKPSPTSDFYVYKNTYYALFDANEISSINNGVTEFPIDINSIVNYTITKDMYYTKKPYNTKFIPLREVAEAFGYRVSWLSNKNCIQLTNSKDTIRIYTDKNLYTLNDTPIRVSTEPDFIDGQTFVPISFFKDALNFSYSILSNEDIIFSK